MIKSVATTSPKSAEFCLSYVLRAYWTRAIERGKTKPFAIFYLPHGVRAEDFPAGLLEEAIDERGTIRHAFARTVAPVAPDLTAHLEALVAEPCSLKVDPPWTVGVPLARLTPSELRFIAEHREDFEIAPWEPGTTLVSDRVYRVAAKHREASEEGVYIFV